MGILIFGAVGLYLLLSISVVIAAITYAGNRGKSAAHWGVGAVLVMYLIPCWDWIPTAVAHRYYCEKEAGFWIYKTPELWMKENPGVMEGLVNEAVLTPISHEGDEENWTNTYSLNKRINQVNTHQGPIALYRWRYESSLVDNKTTEVLARSVDFYTAQTRGGGWNGWKFWLAIDHCPGHRERQVQFGSYLEQLKGVKK